ncbi:zinc-binding dehydrogenase [Leucobacter insecticola]|uniref:Zinc-binding dehydrogenase n=1 Tax=Leucobacter insecticola TaxID=2714934 RepID=A0A6G8FIY3_9MICO|nr:zinc-binding dehydrogenase [Leucobacter insecticola]
MVGSAGSEEKCRWLIEELGFDAALNYRDEDFAEQLRAEFPDGFSVFFDTVGGTQFEFAVQTAAPAARLALCGTLAQQFAAAPGASMPRFEALTAIRKQLVILPFSTFHTPEQIAHWVTHYAAWLAEDRFVFPQSSPAGGLREAPQALIDLGKGKFRGNVVLALD